jgi:ribulose-bisphosphate carboxylase large chain
VWTDRLTACEHYRAKATGRSRARAPGPVFRLHRLRPRSVRGRLDRQPDRLDHRQRVRLQAAEGAAPRGHADSGRLCEDVPGAGDRHRGRARAADKFGRPLLGATVKPKLGLSGRNYGRVVYEALKGGLDFTKDDENINSASRSCIGATAFCTAWRRSTRRRRRPARSRALSQRHRRRRWRTCTSAPSSPRSSARHRHDRPGDRLHGDPVDGEVGARNDMILHLHRAGHGTYTRQKNHGVNLPRDRQMDAAGRRRPHPRRHRGRQARGRSATTRGYYDTAARTSIRCGSSTASVFDQDWASLPTSDAGGLRRHSRRPDASAAHYLGEDVVLQFGGGTIGHPMGSRPAPRPTAWR